MRRVAIVTDIGNDVAYGESPKTILEWVAALVNGLQAAQYEVILSSLPIDAVRSVGRARFAVFRRLLFPSSKLTRSEMLHRAEQVQEGLLKLATERKTPVFSADSSWYGWDPIHPRRRDAWRLWGAMLGRLAHVDGALPRPHITRRLRGEVWRLYLRHDAFESIESHVEAASTTLSNGVRVQLF